MLAIQAINRALFLNGGGSVVNPIDPNSLQEVFTELVNMLNEFLEIPLDLNITIPTDTADEIGNPAWSNAAFEFMLATRSAPLIQLDAPNWVKVRAYELEDFLLTKSAPDEYPEYPDTMPVGTGNMRGPKPRVFYPLPEYEREQKTDVDQ
jgi:hypothetical protein